MSRGDSDKKLPDVGEGAKEEETKTENEKSVDFSAPENINARLEQMILFLYRNCFYAQCRI